MPLWMILFLIALWLFAGWQSWRGFTIGKVLSRGGEFDRHSDPFFFWPMFLIYLFGTIWMPIVVVPLLISRGIS